MVETDLGMNWPVTPRVEFQLANEVLVHYCLMRASNARAITSIVG